MLTLLAASAVLVLLRAAANGYLEQFPYGAIHAVGCDEGGALTIEPANGNELRPLAFHGSIIDGFVGTSERAAREVKRRLGTSLAGKGAGEVRTRFRRDWISDVAAVAALVGTTIALFIGV